VSTSLWFFLGMLAIVLVLAALVTVHDVVVALVARIRNHINRR
jgi:hypothetical protein